jgi:hypothetical protein
LLIAILWTLGVLFGQLRPGAMALAGLLTTVVALCAAVAGLLISLCCKSSLRAVLIATAISLFLSGGYLLISLPLLMSWFAGKDPPIFVLAPCVPVLSVMSIVYGATEQTDPSTILSVCWTGAGIYATTGIALLLIVLRRFDRWAGRAAA